MPWLANNSNIPDEMLLGNLLFYTLQDMTISEADLINIFKNAGLSTNYVRKISKADAFRRASSSIKNRKVVLTEPCKLEINEVYSDNERIVRVIGCKTIDDTETEISGKVKYDAVAEIVFDRNTESVSYKLCSALVNGTINGQSDIVDSCEDVISNYANWSVNHSKDTVRNIFVRFIEGCNPVNLMPTGLCKFIPKTKKDDLYKLKEVSNELSRYTAQPNVLEIIPVMDTMDQRDLIQRSFNSDLSDNLVETIKELNAIIKDKSVLSKRAVDTYMNKYKTYDLKIKEYTALLNGGKEAFAERLGTVLNLIQDNADIAAK